jgi:hypothetical protein
MMVSRRLASEIDLFRLRQASLAKFTAAAVVVEQESGRRRRTSHLAQFTKSLFTFTQTGTQCQGFTGNELGGGPVRPITRVFCDELLTGYQRLASWITEPTFLENRRSLCKGALTTPDANPHLRYCTSTTRNDSLLDAANNMLVAWSPRTLPKLMCVGLISVSFELASIGTQWPSSTTSFQA